MNKIRFLFLSVLLICIYSTIAFGYRQSPDDPDVTDPNNYTHQKITKEAEKAWNFMPYNIKKIYIE
ncbi:MAG TPA: hypothetical protein VJB94_04410 [Candidatus Nanoarchaeia archaeon]|nr:hypothetical protein [Candidatus Nanoarchaeia archaeon]